MNYPKSLIFKTPILGSFKNLKYGTAILIFCFFFSCKKENGNLPALAPDYFQDEEIETVFKNSENGINIVFIGDGYIKTDLEKPTGNYRKDAIKHLDKLFNTLPFSQYQEYFNAYIIYAESKDLGPSNSPREKNTALGTIQGDPNPIDYNTHFLRNYVQNLIPDFDIFSNETFVLLSIKNGKGGIVLYQNSVALFSNTNENTMVHEVGHAFAVLGDEYENHTNCNDCTTSTEIYPNLDNTADLNKVKWNHFIGLEGYEAVGAFEGGGYTTSGIWRPEENSIMRNSSFSHFNAPSREAIVKKIMAINGIPYSFQEFIEKDKVALDYIKSAE